MVLYVPFPLIWYVTWRLSEKNVLTFWPPPPIGGGCVYVCLIWFFTSHQQSFCYTGTGLPGLYQYKARINVSCSRTTTQWRRWGSMQRLFGLESSTLPLCHCTPWLCVWTEYVLVWCSTLHSLTFDIHHDDYFQKMFWPVDPAQGPRLCVRTELYTGMVCYAPFPLMWYATWLLSEKMFWPFDSICGVRVYLRAKYLLPCCCMCHSL